MMKWLALVLLLCGCASKQAVVQRPQVSTEEFAVTTFPNDVYMITYKGSSNVPNERLQDLALLKASQVAQQLQYKYLVIIDQAASKAGEVKYRPSLPDPAEWNNELLVQGFKSRPDRVFCFLAQSTEEAIYEKLRTSPAPESL